VASDVSAALLAELPTGELLSLGAAANRRRRKCGLLERAASSYAGTPGLTF